MLLGRLPLALKFLVIGVVLSAPLGFVVYAYVDAENSHVSFSAKERIGVRAMAPLLRLTMDAARARGQATESGHPAAVPFRDVEAASRAQRRYGRALGTRTEWSRVAGLLAAAGGLSGESARASYDRAAQALLRLIVHVGDGSNLTLDPDLDTYYLMDAVQFRTPALIDEIGQISLRWDQAAASHDPRVTPRLRGDTGVALGTIESVDAALDNSIHTAAAHTANRAVMRTLPALLGDVDTKVKALDARLRYPQARGHPLALRFEGAAALEAADRLTSETVPQLDRLLAARISASEGREHRVELLAAVAFLVAIYLFVGFYRCIVVPVRRMVATLRAVASGDHSRHVHVDNRDELGFVAKVLNDMVDKVRQATERLAHEATHDILTGLPNRALVLQRLERMLPRAADRALSVLFIDLDGFKPVNDSIGHAAGDEVLRTVATRLSAIVRPEDVLARLAGDEFLVVAASLPDAPAAVALAGRMLEGITPEIPVRDSAGDLHHVVVGASIGVAFVSDPRMTAEQVIRNADVAMYRAKQRGRGRVELFGEPLREAVEERQLVHQELRGAIKKGELEVHYQPIVELTGARTIGFEALVRWRHPDRGLLAPGAFIPIAEETWLINAIGAQVLRAACRQLGLWSAMPGDLYMSVNLSARQLTDPELVAIVDEALTENGIEPSSLCLEITETALLADPAAAAGALDALHGMGVRLALDDFGTGYSSLQHLKDFPLDLIKLDRSFVSGLAADGSEGDDAIVSGIIDLARALSLGVVAEGVETPAQHARLLVLGCDTAQGYLFGRPAAPEVWFGEQSPRPSARTGARRPVDAVYRGVVGPTISG